MAFKSLSKYNNFGENFFFLNQNNVVFVLFVHKFNEKCHPDMLEKKLKRDFKSGWDFKNGQEEIFTNHF